MSFVTTQIKIIMKETVYRAKHEALGAKMEEFAGFYMPIQYDSITNEHLQVRNKVGVFDVSHWASSP